MGLVGCVCVCLGGGGGSYNLNTHFEDAADQVGHELDNPHPTTLHAQPHAPENAQRVLAVAAHFSPEARGESRVPVAPHT